MKIIKIVFGIILAIMLCILNLSISIDINKENFALAFGILTISELIAMILIKRFININKNNL